MRYLTSEEMMQWCKDLRKRKKLTQKQLAEEMNQKYEEGVSQPQIAQAENDPDSMRDRMRLRIIEHLTGKKGEQVYRFP